MLKNPRSEQQIQSEKMNSVVPLCNERFLFLQKRWSPPLTTTLGNPQHTPAPGPAGGCPPHLSPSPASACFERDISRLMQHLPAHPPQGMKDSQTPLHTKASGDAKAGRCQRKGNPGLPLTSIQAPNTLIACQLQEAFWGLGFFFFLLPACFSTVVWAEADPVRCLEEPGASHT